mgnify:CR=1 FL=1
MNRDVLDMHLNGDETVALGSAFRAANVSTAFKPRFVGMTDISPFSVGVELYRSVKESEAGSEVRFLNLPHLEVVYESSLPTGIDIQFQLI